MKKTLYQNQSIIEAFENLKVKREKEEHSNKQSYESEIERKMAEDLSDSDQEFHGFIDSKTDSYHSNDSNSLKQLRIKLEMKQLLMKRRLIKMITIHILLNCVRKRLKLLKKEI